MSKDFEYQGGDFDQSAWMTSTWDEPVVPKMPVGQSGGQSASPAARFGKSVSPHVDHAIKLRRTSGSSPLEVIFGDFESATFAVEKNFSKARRAGKPVQPARVFDSQDVEGIFGGYVDSIGYVAQYGVSRGKKRRPTLLLMDGQEVQFIQDKPLVNGKADPSARNVGVVFRFNNVTQQHAQMLVDSFEKNGEVVDISKLKITGTPEFKIKMKAALQAEQDRRQGDTAKLCNAWSGKLFSEFKDAAMDGKLVNIGGQFTQIDKDHPYAKSMLKDSQLAEAIGNQLMFGGVPKPTISKVYSMIGPGSRDPSNVSMRPNWTAIAPMVGINPETGQKIQSAPPAPVAPPAPARRPAPGARPQ